jgi:hypothetical protein
MEAALAIVTLACIGALLCGFVFRFLAFRNREPDASYARSLLDDSGFTARGQRYLRRQYVALSVAFLLVLLSIAIRWRS